MPPRAQASASSFRMSRLNGVASTMLYGLALDLNMAKPSWCLDVMTMYFMPASFASLHPGVRVELDRVEAGREPLVLLDRHLRTQHHPFAEARRALAVPFARRYGVEAPMNEEAVLGVTEPFEALLLCGIRSRGRLGRYAGRPLQRGERPTAATERCRPRRPRHARRADPVSAPLTRTQGPQRRLGLFSYSLRNSHEPTTGRRAAGRSGAL